MIEPINVTIERVAKIWSAMEDKRPLLQSFGFSDENIEGYLNWMLTISTDLYLPSVETYTRLQLEEGEDQDLAVVKAVAMTIGDLAIMFMLLARERERLEDGS